MLSVPTPRRGRLSSLARQPASTHAPPPLPAPSTDARWPCGRCSAAPHRRAAAKPACKRHLRSPGREGLTLGSPCTPETIEATSILGAAARRAACCSARRRQRCSAHWGRSRHSRPLRATTTTPSLTLSFMQRPTRCSRLVRPIRCSRLSTLLRRRQQSCLRPRRRWGRCRARSRTWRRCLRLRGHPQCRGRLRCLRCRPHHHRDLTSSFPGRSGRRILRRRRQSRRPSRGRPRRHPFRHGQGAAL